ncbi:MAG: hypothetical protein JWQ09_6102 [Segetibacter sp.]|nr:hypothetical protein [Segetibacter sp.]
MKLLPWLTLLFLFLVVTLNAQLITPNFYRLTNNEGLSQASVNVIFKDSEGFLWIGTDDGLNRFDGKNVETFYYRFNDSTTLAANEVYGICEDRIGRIWVSHYNGGISCFDKRTSKFNRLFTIKTKAFSLSTNRIYGLYCDKQGFIWARSVLGISKIDPRNFSVTNYDDVSIEDISTANIDITETTEYIWFGSKEKGLLRVTKKGVIESLRKWDLHKNGKAVFGIYALSSDQLLVTSEKGLFRVFKNNKMFEVEPVIIDTTLFHRSSKLFKERNSPAIWIATDLNGILIADLEKKKIIQQIKSRSIKDNLASNTIFDLFEDDEQNVFIATDRGVNVYSPYSSIFNNYENIFRNIQDFGHPVYSLYELSNRNILIGSKSGGGYYFNPATLQVKPFIARDVVNAGKLSVYHFATWKNNEMLVATSNGIKGLSIKNDNAILHSLNGIAELHILDSLSVTDILVANDTVVWFSTIRDGLFKWSCKRHSLQQYRKNDVEPRKGPVDNQLLDIALTTEGNLALSTKSGFSIYYPAQDTFLNLFPGKHFPYELPARNNKSAYDDGKYIWISTYGAGVQKWNKQTRTFTAVTTEQGLPNDAVYAVIPDMIGNLWISTNNGLAALNIKTGNINVYTTQDGLPDNEFNAYAGYRSNSGLIFYSTLNGIVSVNPKQLSTNNFNPNVALTWFSANNGQKDTTMTTYKNASFTLPAGYNSIYVKFAALSFAAPGKNLYKVKLEGFDKDWLFLSNEAEIRYTKLPPGNYVFSIQATNNSQKWNNKVFSCKINVLPFWYQTWGFKLLIALMVVALSYSFYRYRVNQILQVEKFRRKISSDLHDDIGSTLSSINIYSELAKHEKENGKYIDTIQLHTRTIINSLDDLVWSINPKNDSVIMLVERMRSFAIPFLEAQKIKIEFIYEIENESGNLSLEQRSNLYFAYKEMINNVAKHSDSTFCSVVVVQKERSFVIEVKDNGKGFTANGVNHHRNGLQNLKQRAAENNGLFKVQSSPGEGSTFIFKVNY